MDNIVKWHGVSDFEPINPEISAAAWKWFPELFWLTDSRGMR